MGLLDAISGSVGALSSLGSAVVRIGLDTSGLTAGLAKAQAQTEAGVAKMDATAGSVGAGGGSGIAALGSAWTAAGAVAAAAVVKIGIESVKAFDESERAMAQTQAVLQSTGGAANVTSQQVLDLAASVASYSGINDEAVQSSENLLLTFRDVHNEVGAGNDIFTQATKAVADMTTALNLGAIPSAEDLKAKTIQLGKALNDPIKGMTALRRVGVSFTQAQVDQVTALQESGDLLSAQKIILAELHKEFGGAAKAAGDTLAGALGKLGTQVGNVGESIGAVLVPALTEVVKAMVEVESHVGTAIDLFAHFDQGVANTLPGLIGFANAIKQAADSQKLEASVNELNRQFHAGTLSEAQFRAGLKNLQEQGAKVDIGQVVAQIKAAGGAFRHTTSEVQRFGSMSGQVLEDWKADARTSMAFAETAFDDLADKAHLSAQKILRSLQQANRDQAKFADNSSEFLGKVARGMSPELTTAAEDMVSELASQGREGASRMDALAGASDKMAQKIVASWLKSQKSAATFVGSLQNVDSWLARIANHSVDIPFSWHWVGGPPPDPGGAAGGAPSPPTPAGGGKKRGSPIGAASPSTGRGVPVRLQLNVDSQRIYDAQHRLDLLRSG